MLNLLQLRQKHFRKWTTLSIYGGDKLWYFKKRVSSHSDFCKQINIFFFFPSFVFYESNINGAKEEENREKRFFPNKVQEEEKI